MVINQDKCIKCGQCIPFCGMSAIKRTNGKVEIDLNECVECCVCQRSMICPVGALELQPLDEKRSTRIQFSDPLTPHPTTTLAGRGTEEIKTNDVTGRTGPGSLGFGVEMGRPGIGTWMTDVQTVARAIAPLGVKWEESNPIAALMIDKNTGDFNPDYLDIKVLSCILEFTIKVEQLESLIVVLVDVAKQINTVFSVSMISVFDDQGDLPGLDILEKMDVRYRQIGRAHV